MPDNAIGPANWKRVDKAAILNDGLTPFKSVLRWNTYKTQLDLTVWRMVNPEKESTYRMVDSPEIRNALALSFVDHSNGQVQGDCRLSENLSHTLAMNEAVQIPFRHRVLTFKPITRWMVPDDPMHAVQRRVHRVTGVDVPDAEVKSLLEEGKSVIPLDKHEGDGGDGGSVTVKRSGGGAVSVWVNWSQQTQQVFP